MAHLFKYRLYLFLLFIAAPVIFGAEDKSHQDALYRIAGDLNADGKEMKRDKKLMVLIFSVKGCIYCERMKRDHLTPFSKSNNPYAGRVIFREILMDRDTPLKDFSGKQSTTKTLAAKYEARYSPTVVFLNDKGDILAETIIGYQTPDFFDYYFEESLKTAFTKLGG